MRSPTSAVTICKWRTGDTFKPFLYWPLYLLTHNVKVRHVWAATCSEAPFWHRRPNTRSDFTIVHFPYNCTTYNKIWYDIWYDTICYDTIYMMWYDIWYIWYDTIRYDLIHIKLLHSVFINYCFDMFRPQLVLPQDGSQLTVVNTVLPARVPRYRAVLFEVKTTTVMPSATSQSKETNNINTL
jgi:hypothetical protein